MTCDRCAIRRRITWLLLLCLGAGSCANEDQQAQEIGCREQALAARCSVNVLGFGDKDVERDYLPNVVNCENGGADTEQLKAQAVAARTYLYYKLEQTGGSISSSTSTQVYDCARKKYLEQKHYDAVNATAGQVIMHNGLVIWSCYNAGTERTPPDCKPTGTGADACVTYNEGKSGSDVTPSPCGHPANPKNRGCMAQNGGHCLSLTGRKYPEILRYYYGADIDIVTATGSCITPAPLPDVGVPPADAAAGDDPLFGDGGPEPLPRTDGGFVARRDAARPGSDAAQPGSDGGEEPVVLSGGPVVRDRYLHGGCALALAADEPSTPPWCMLALGLLLCRAARRRNRVIQH